MNRVIKFRGKRKDNGKWWYGSLISWPDGDAEIANLCKDEEGNKFLVHPETIGQYTGIVDSNGREIFEGDLIRFAENFLYLVKYEDAKFVGYHANKDWGKWGDIYKLGEVGFNNYNYVIIGNIHDNPELLNPASGQSGVNNMINDPNVKTEEEVKEPAEQAPAPAPEAQPGSAEGENEG